MALLQQKGLPLDLWPSTLTRDLSQGSTHRPPPPQPSPGLRDSLSAVFTGAGCGSGLSEVESRLCYREGESVEREEDGWRGERRGRLRQRDEEKGGGRRRKSERKLRSSLCLAASRESNTRPYWSRCLFLQTSIWCLNLPTPWNLILFGVFL